MANMRNVVDAIQDLGPVIFVEILDSGHFGPHWHFFVGYGHHGVEELLPL